MMLDHFQKCVIVIRCVRAIVPANPIQGKTGVLMDRAADYKHSKCYAKECTPSESRPFSSEELSLGSLLR